MMTLAYRTEKIAEASCMGFFGFRQRLKPVGYFGEAFFTSRLCHARVHIGVLVSLAMNGRFEIQLGIAERLVSRGVAYLLEVVEMTVRVPGFTFSGVAKVAGDLGISFDIGDLRKVEIPAVSHRLAGECVLQVLVRFASF